MAVQGDLGSRLTGVPQQRPQGQLYIVPVAMGHVNVAAAQPGHQNKGQILPAGIGITVSGHLIKCGVGEQLLQVKPVGVIVSQMKNTVRLPFFRAFFHKRHGMMTVR